MLVCAGPGAGLPVAKRLTISAAGSTSSMGMARDGSTCVFESLMDAMMGICMLMMNAPPKMNGQSPPGPILQTACGGRGGG